MRALSLFIVVVGCSAQFDFDTEPLDAGVDSSDGKTADEVGAEVDVLDDAASGGRVVCGTTSCALPARACCIVDTTPLCIEVSEVTCPGTLIRCDSSNDCATGHVCCATLPDGGPPSAQCRDRTSCRSPEQVILCDPSDPIDCTTCVPASPPFPAGYHQCT